MNKSKAANHAGAGKALPSLAVAAQKQKQPGSTNDSGKKLATQGPSNRLDSIPSRGPATGLEISTNQKVLPAIKSMVARFEDMLRGHLDDLPSKPPSEVRVFLSSTFSDLRAERNLIVQDAYPCLKQFCADLDLDFQLVDMRWGVTDDATNEHITEKLCMEEIRNCQKISLGPNYVVILGDRYGYRPIPSELTEKEFNMIKMEVEGLTEVKYLQDWYKKDENACPPVYLLQPIKTHLPHFGDYSEGNEKLRKQDSATWWQTLQALQKIFQDAASSAHAQNRMTAAEKHSFHRSVTECEVEYGIFQADNPAQHTTCYIRELEGLDSDALHDSVAQKYIDCKTVNEESVLDEEVGMLREDLSKRVSQLLSPYNSSQYTVLWQMGGISCTNDKHDEYLKQFCARFVDDLKRLVEQGLYAKKNVIPAGNYFTDFEEVLHHLHFTRAKCATFRGREDIFDKVRNYLKDGQNRKPLIIHAESGGGKTSIMAMLMKLLPQWFGEDCIRIIRYLGTSRFSQDIYSVLRSISGQLADVQDTLLEPVGTKNMKTMNTYLPRFFRKISRKTKNPVFILLDSIDQLSAKDGAYSMKWLPLELPANINIIISTLPDLHGCLDNIRAQLPDEKCYIEVKPLPQTTSVEIVDSYLVNHKRVLTTAQRNFVLEQMHQTPTPLFLKLLLDQAVLWKSFTPVDHMRVADSVRAAIQQLFEELEGRFGKIVVSRTLGYITCGLNGLTEVELEDALSCDDETLNEVYQYHNPPVDGIVRLPPVIWVRIKQEIQEYLTERKSFSKTTLYWYHRQFIEAAEDRYTDNEQGHLIHQKLSLLYGAENGIKRDVTLSKRKITVTNADRQVSKQPMTPRNLRMLEALPYHAVNSGDVDFMKSIALCNLRFMMTRTAGFSLATLINDISNAIWTLKAESKSDYELEILLETLEAMKASFKKADSLPVELLGRIHQDTHATGALGELLRQAKATILEQNQSTLLPLYPCLSSSELIEWVLKDCVAPIETSVRGTRALVMKNNNKSAVVDFEAEDTLLEDVDVEFGHKGMLLLSGDGNFIYSLHMPTVSDKSTKSGKKSGVLILDKWQTDRKVDTKTFSYVCDAKSIACYTVDAKCLSVVHDNHCVSVWDQTSMKPLRSCVNFDNFSHLYAVWSAGSGMLLILAARQKVEETGTGEQNSEGGIVVMNTTTRGKESIIVLPRPLMRKNLQICTRRKLLLGYCIQDGLTKIIIADYSELTYQVVTQFESLFTPVFCLHPISSIVLLCDPTGVEIHCHDLAEISLVTLKFGIEGKISSVALDPDGEHIVAGTTLGDFYIWHYEGHHVVGHQKTETNHIMQMSITKSEEFLVVLSEDTTLTVWNWKLLLQKLSTTTSSESSGPVSEHLMAHKDASEVGFAAGVLYTVTDRCIRCWDLNSCLSSQHYNHANNITKVATVLDDGHLLFSDDAGKLISYNISTSTTQNFFDKDVRQFTLDAKRQTAYVLVEKSKTLMVHIFNVLEGNTTRSIAMKGTVTSNTNIELGVTDDGAQLALAVTLTTSEVDIITKSEKKNNLKSMTAPSLKFYSINLNAKKGTASLQICNRILTQIPCLGASWAVHNTNSIIIGRERTVLLWDLDNLKCDQRISKADTLKDEERRSKVTKIAMFFRPEWLEDEGQQFQVCHGPTLCMERSLDGRILAVGSADGFMLIYDMGFGLCIQKEEELRKSNHAAPVVQVAVSANGSFVAAYSSNRLMKLWQIAGGTSAQEVFSISFPAKVIKMTFSTSEEHLSVITQTPNQKTQVLLFKVIDGKITAS